MKYRVAPLVVAFLLGVGPVRAQDGVVYQADVRGTEGALLFDRFALQDGLPDNTVTALLQDRFGFLWVGTRNGLARFDGYRFETWAADTDPDPSGSHDGLSSGSVTGLFEDGRGHLWVMTWNGLNRYDPATNTFRHYLRSTQTAATGSSLTDGWIRSVYEDRAGGIWIGTPFGLFEYDAAGDSLRRHLPRPDITEFDPNLFATKGNEISDMLEDRSGRFWVATFDDVYRFEREAEQFVPLRHRPDSTFGLTAIRQGYSLFESSGGEFWIIAKARDGFDRFDPVTGAATRYKLDELPFSRDFSDNAPRLVEDDAGTLWAIAAEGPLYQWDPVSGGFARMEIPTQVGISRIRYPFHRTLRRVASGDVLFASGDRGLIRIRPDGRFDQYLFDPDAVTASLNEVRTTLVDRFGSVWIGSAQGLYRLNQESSLFGRTALGLNTPVAMQAEPTGGVWLAMAGPTLQQISSTGAVLSSYSLDRTRVDSMWVSTVLDVHRDDSGRIWVAGDSGIDVLDPVQGIFHHRIESDTTYHPDLFALAESLQSRNRTAAVILRSGDNADRSVPFQLARPTRLLVVAMGECTDADLGMDDDAWIEDTDGARVWSIDCRMARHAGGDERNIVQVEPVLLPAGSYRLRNRTDDCGEGVPCHAFGTWNVVPPVRPEWYGIQAFRLDEPDLQKVQSLLDPYFPVDGLPATPVRTFLRDRAGQLWIGMPGHLARVEEGTLRFTSFALPVNDRNGNQVLTIHEDPRGRMWVGTMHGLYRFDRESGIFQPAPIGRDVSIARIESDESGRLWIGSDIRGLGLLHEETNTMRWLDRENADLPSSGLLGMARDSGGMLWLLHARGLTRVDPRTETFISFNQAHGLPTFSLGGLLGRTETGDILVSGDNGFVQFRPSELRANPVPPLVALTRFRLTGPDASRQPDSVPRFLYDTRRIVLAHNQNDFTIDFVGLHFSNPARNQYMTFLEEYDVEWQRIGDRRSVSYTNLDPGRYVFRVRAANADGIWSDEDATLEIVIRPPWWQTIWAYGGYLLLLLGSLYGAGAAQRRLITARERRRMEIERARLRAETAEMEARALKAENERNSNVELLSRIGQKITSNLSLEQIIDTVYENVNALMDASGFGIGLLDEEARTLDFPATKERGETLPPYSFSVDDVDRLAVRCLTRREEIIINDYATEYHKYVSTDLPSPAGDEPESILYLPLQHRNRMIGVITTQSFSKNAYNEFHLNVLRTLATYTAIALDNADAYRRLGQTVEDLRSTQEQLVHQEKLASLGQLTAGIAHEIKNPLNFVNNFADLNAELLSDILAVLQGDPDRAVGEVLELLHEELKDLADNTAQIARHGRRADGIVQAMMQHARGDVGVRQQTDVNALVDEYVNLAFHGRRASAAGFRVTIERDLDPAVGEAMLVPQDIGRVVLNLLSNAFDAVTERAASEGPEYRPQVHVTTRRLSSAEIEVRVSDNGTGIPDAIREKVFEPFVTTKPPGSGTGLGLSLSYDVVQGGHSGTMTVENVPGGGALFVIRLPG